ncbi:MAG TPA: hypothetical protein VGI19_11485 [Candidatus Cybelea sp.]
MMRIDCLQRQARIVIPLGLRSDRFGDPENALGSSQERLRVRFDHRKPAPRAARPSVFCLAWGVAGIMPRFR